MRAQRMEISAPDFDLEKTLDSGQVFHWEKVGKGFVGTIGDCAVVHRTARRNVLAAWNNAEKLDGLKPSSLQHLSQLFRARSSARGNLRVISGRSDHERGANFCRGLRIIRQPKWECLATFICSSMKQVAHIRQISLALRRRFGERRKIGDRVASHVSAVRGELPELPRMICANARWVIAPGTCS